MGAQPAPHLTGYELREPGTLSVSRSPNSWGENIVKDGKIYEISAKNGSASFANLDSISHDDFQNVMDWGIKQQYFDGKRTTDALEGFLDIKGLLNYSPACCHEALAIGWAKAHASQMSIQGVWFTKPVPGFRVVSGTTRGGIFHNMKSQFYFDEIALSQDPGENLPGPRRASVTF